VSYFGRPHLPRTHSFPFSPISCNALEIFPTALYEMRHIHYLNVSSNQIRYIPPGISNFKEIVELHFASNHLFALPNEIGQLTTVQVIDVRDNSIGFIPSSIGNLDILDILLLEGNGLTLPPPEVIAQGVEATKSYLRSVPTEPKELYRAKLIFLGKTGSGKSSVLKAIEKHIEQNKKKTGTLLPNLSNPDLSVTRSVLAATGKQEEKVPLELSFWDFTTSEIAASSHSFFASEKAVYVLVWNITEKHEDTRLDFWLQSIYASNSKPPTILLVATHIDDAACTRQYIQDTVATLVSRFTKQFPTVVEPMVFPVSCTKKTGFDRLFQAVEVLASTLPWMGDKISPSFFALEQIIADQIQRNPARMVVPWSEYSVMTKTVVSSDYEMIQIISLLQAHSTIQCYGGTQGIVTLQPQWLSEFAKCVLSAEPVRLSGGVISLEVCTFPPLSILLGSYHSQTLGAFRGLEVCSSCSRIPTRSHRSLRER
jgi:GTPase SAR1 family protein